MGGWQGSSACKKENPQKKRPWNPTLRKTKGGAPRISIWLKARAENVSFTTGGREVHVTTRAVRLCGRSGGNSSDSSGASVPHANSQLAISFVNCSDRV